MEMNVELEVEDAVFIHAVQKHPQMWDPAYSYTESKKMLLWKDIVKELVPGYCDLHHKEQKSLEIQCISKWGKLKNAFITETKKRLSPGYDMREAKYYDMLKFIYPCLSPAEYKYCHSGQKIPEHLQNRHNAHITLNRKIQFSEVMSAYLDSKLIAQRAFGIITTKEDFLADDHTFSVLLKGKVLEPEDPEEQRKITAKLLQKFLKESDQIKKEMDEKEKNSKNEKQTKKEK